MLAALYVLLVAGQAAALVAALRCGRTSGDFMPGFRRDRDPLGYWLVIGLASVAVAAQASMILFSSLR